MSELDDYANIVYAIRNKINNKYYIGKSIKTFNARYNKGLERHHNPHLRRSIEKYGIHNFEIILLEKCVSDINELNNLEIKYIKEFKSYDPRSGYNKTYGGEGVQHTAETRAKTSRALTGKPKSEEHRHKLSAVKVGKDPFEKMSEEFKRRRNEKLSKALSGKNNPMYGRKASLETRKKLSDARRGEKNSMYGKNIKDHMSPEAYEQWKKNVSNKGAKNGRARKTIIIYKEQKYEFEYASEGIVFFKEQFNEPISINWMYKGINPKMLDKFQFIGYEEKFTEYIKHCL